MKTNVTCPTCGTELTIEVKNAHKKNVSATATAANPNTATGKAASRIQALATAGYDVTGLFAVQGAAGEILVRMVNGVPTAIDENDPIFASIMAEGTVPDRRLFRRWVMAQMFRMLSSKHWYGGDYTKAMHCKGYEYTWEMTVEEFRVQAKLAANDPENFLKRNRWFNKEVAVKMVEDYFKVLKQYFDGLKEKHCKGVPYKTIGGTNVFVADFYKKFISPLNHYKWAIERAKNPQELYKAVANFNYERTKLPWDTKQSAAWVEAYKGSGAYYTLQNLILFHGAVLTGKYNKKLNKAGSLAYLEELAGEYSASGSDGWRMLACMKKAIDDNGIDIDKKRAEWAAKKRANLNK